MRFTGKIILITGAAQGIGKAAACRMAREGAHVVIADLDGTEAEKTADEIIRSGHSAVACQADVRDSMRIQQIVAETVRRSGDIDILVNNAGGPALWSGKGSLFIDSEAETWRRILDINLLGTMIVTHAVLQGMIRKHKGKIVNVGSVAGVNGLVGMADYSAAKGGVIALTRALAIELGAYCINVNCVSPGSIETRHGPSPETFLKRTGLPEEAADLIAFLASEESNFITGQNYIIDGGRCLSTKC